MQRRGQRGKQEAEEKEGENRQRGFLALGRAGTLARGQASACVGRAATDADGSRGRPTVLLLSCRMFRHGRTRLVRATSCVFPPRLPVGGIVNTAANNQDKSLIKVKMFQVNASFGRFRSDSANLGRNVIPNGRDSVRLFQSCLPGRGKIIPTAPVKEQAPLQKYCSENTSQVEFETKKVHE